MRKHLQIPPTYSRALDAFSASFCVRSTVKRISHALALTHKRKWSTCCQMFCVKKSLLLSPISSAAVPFIPTPRQMETGHGSNE